MRLAGTTLRSLLSMGLAAAFCATSAQASLTGRLPATPGGTDWQAFYDDELDITWTASGGLLGSGHWQPAVDWAAALVIGHAVDWRLPSMNVDGLGVPVLCNVVTQAECLDNELGYHYWHNGITAMAGSMDPFNNVVAAGYWSSSTDGGSFAFTLSFDTGNQGAGGIGTDNAHAWAVHDGDVGVPEPGAALLISLSLIALLGSRRR